MHLPMSMFWRLEQHVLLVKAGADLPVAILNPSHGQHTDLAVLEEHTTAQQQLAHAHRHARAHPCARSSTAHLPVAQTVSRPSISSFMTSSAMARRALTLYADPGGSQHRVVQHHEQQLGQPEHGGGINAEGKLARTPSS